jgi:hypothetical protein
MHQKQPPAKMALALLEAALGAAVCALASTGSPSNVLTAKTNAMRRRNVVNIKILKDIRRLSS